MQITLDTSDISKLSPAARAELTRLLFPKAQGTQPKDATDFDWSGVVDFDLAAIKRFAERCSEKTMAGLRVFAEHGPVIDANLLNSVGIENFGQFQGAVTKRTRTVSEDPESFMFTWDDWTDEENAARGFGRYAISEKTYRALRQHFGIE